MCACIRVLYNAHSKTACRARCPLIAEWTGLSLHLTLVRPKHCSVFFVLACAQVHTGKGGKQQWRPIKKKDGPNIRFPVMMLTTDVALINDDQYLYWTNKYWSDMSTLNRAFASAW